VQAPFLPTAFARAADVARIGRLCSECTACRGMHVWGIEPGRCGSRAVAVVLARDVTKEYSLSHPLPWVQCAGTFRAHGCCGCGVVPPSGRVRFRVCSKLSNNALNGCVPSSLSALINLEYLCVPPACPLRRAAFARAAEVARIGRLCSEQRGMSGDACLGHRAGAVRQQGCCGALRGDLGHAM
jgi:hypothetical protein